MYAAPVCLASNGAPTTSVLPWTAVESPNASSPAKPTRCWSASAGPANASRTRSTIATAPPAARRRLRPAAPPRRAAASSQRRSRSWKQPSSDVMCGCMLLPRDPECRCVGGALDAGAVGRSGGEPVAAAAKRLARDADGVEAALPGDREPAHRREAVPGARPHEHELHVRLARQLE